MVKRTIAAEKVALDSGLTCIGEICFGPDGIIVKVPEDADPKCTKKIADYILGGRRVKFEVEAAETLKGDVAEKMKEDEAAKE